MPIKTYKDLDVFREAYTLALDIPEPRSCFQVMNNLKLDGNYGGRLARFQRILEGWAKRASPVEFKRYLQISDRFNVLGAMPMSLWKNRKSFAD